MPRRNPTNPEVHILCGPARSDRHARMLDRLRDHWGSVLLLVPSSRLASQRLEELLLTMKLPGTWRAPVQTFQSFAASVVREQGINADLLTEMERRAVLERALASVRRRGELDDLRNAASTPGFATHMLRVITQLKQAAVEPSEFRMRAAQRSQPHWLDSVVAAVYEEYQSALIATGRYDLVGLYWQAELMWRQRRPRDLERVRHLLLDGFDDFTPSEFRLIESVAPHLDTLVFGMTCSFELPDQSDLYQVPRKTIDRIQAAFRTTPDESNEMEPERLTHYVGRHLFWRDKPQPPGTETVDIDLAVYTNPVQEIEGVARRVKRLILGGTAPRGIAVAYRDLRESAEMIRAVFREYGIPARVGLRPSLAQCGIGRFLITLLDIGDVWRREAVLDVVTSPWFLPSGTAVEEYRGWFPALARMAQIVEGREDWLRRIAQLPATLSREADSNGKRRRSFPPQEACAALQQAVIVLDHVLGGIATARNDQEFVTAVWMAMDRLGVKQALDSLPDARAREVESAAWTVLEALLGKLAQWVIAGVDTGLDARADRIRRALASMDFPVAEDRDGVQVLSAESARHLKFQHVFFCGLVEGAVPQSAPSSAIYTEDDLSALERAGVSLETRTARNARERLLFHHVCSLPRERLYLSWHARGHDDRETAPSPFLADVRELVGSRVPLADQQLEAPAGPEQAMSLRELRCADAAAKSACPGFDAELGWVRRAAALERRRHDRAPFDAYDGRVRADDVVAALQDRYGPDHRFSARQLEAYARCPFRFLVQEVFRIEPCEDPAPELDAMTRGLLLHDALYRFHTRFRGRPVAEIQQKTAETAMRAAVDDTFVEAARADGVAPPAVLAAEKARMTRDLLRYLEFERQAGGDWRPSHFEVAFGRPSRPNADEWSREECFPLQTPAGPILLSGVIDRIDVGTEGVRILDYKSSIAQHTAKALNEGVDLQLLLYVEVVEQALCEGQPCLGAKYIHVGHEKDREALGEDRRAIMLEKVAVYVTGIRAGVFTPVPYAGSCKYCAYRRVCRYETGRVARKDPAI